MTAVEAEKQEGTTTVDEPQQELEVEPQTQTASLPTHYAIERELANAILNYLASRPYSEVFSMVDGMRQLEPVEYEKD
jgi:hypothetical protein